MMWQRCAPLSFLLALALALPGCSSKSAVLAFPMGQRVQVGKLHYQVLEAEWQTEVQGAKQPPKNRILRLRMTVTNSGGQETSMPLLHLIDAAGNEIMEIAELEGNSSWLGALRRLQPAITEEGSIYFDVPVGAYKLVVVDQTIPDDEKTALIEIPASLAPPTVPASPGV